MEGKSEGAIIKELHEDKEQVYTFDDFKRLLSDLSEKIDVASRQHGALRVLGKLALEEYTRASIEDEKKYLEEMIKLADEIGEAKDQLVDDKSMDALEPNNMKPYRKVAYEYQYLAGQLYNNFNMIHRAALELIEEKEAQEVVSDTSEQVEHKAA